ncbi:hypothetical protein FHL81_10955 [Agrobacterium tumefaciens]|uniref:hypothetical protein n=1 Tax=Agrobacterium tumefaciens TaxID=358 RepID=UPI0011F40232|nr:hypothetical protein [Agrobacterium tumefaciens]KAA1237150.1 hypothetical protein FHL81_10955 [Agrobacterium tumefaciens]
MTKTKTSTRTFSKRATAWSLFGIYVLAFYGVSVGYPGLAELITVVGSAAVAHLVLYMGVGHLDMRSLTAQGLLDLRRKGGKPDV